MNAPRRPAVHGARTRRGTAALALALSLLLGSAVASAAELDAPPDPTTPAPPPTTVPAATTTTTTTTTVPPATTTTTTTTSTTSTTVAAVPATPTTAPAAPPPPPPTTAAPPPPPPAPAPRNISVDPAQLGHILATIRYLESRGDYTAPPNRGNASGAYQFIASTWDDYGGYPHAYLAPPHVQDERAALDVAKFLERFDNDVSMIPVMWYFPAAANDPSLMDVVPMPWAGNKLTIREYQVRWLGVFSFLSGLPVPPVKGTESYQTLGGLPPQVPPPHDGVPSIAFPVLGPARVAAPDCDNESASDHRAAGLCVDAPPAIVFGVKLQPVLAVADGVVTAVDDRPGSGRPITVTVTDLDGRSYTYAGFNDDSPGADDGAAPDHLRLSALAKVGSTVRAGQILGFMGDTDPIPVGVREDVPTDRTVRIDPDAVAPHVRLTITERDGTPVDAYGPVIDALFRHACSVAIGPWAVPPNGSGHWPVIIETTDDDRAIDSQWLITDTGQVTAAGWAAMIFPNDGCGYAPPQAHGPGAAGGNEVPLSWLEPIELPTTWWIELALAAEELPPLPLQRI